MKISTNLAFAFGLGSLLVACDAQDAKDRDETEAAEEDDGDEDKGGSDTKKKAPFKAKKVETGKVDLADACDDAYPIEKHDNGKVAACAIKEAVEVGDVTCKKHGRPGTFEDGTLSNCGIEGVLEVGPFKCHKGVHFYEDGMPKDCYLKEPGEADGKECKSRVTFNEDGTIDTCK